MRRKYVSTIPEQQGDNNQTGLRIPNIIAETQKRYLDARDPEEIYRIAAEKIQNLLADGYTIATTLDDPTQSMRISAYCGFEGIVENIISILHSDPRKSIYPLKDMTAEDLKLFRSGKLELYKGGIYELFLGKIPQAACTMLERLLRIKRIYTMGLVSQGLHFGGITILVKHDMEDIKWAIELLIGQAAIMINQFRSNIALRITEERYRTTLDNMLEGCQIIDFGYRYMYLNEMAIKQGRKSREELTGKTMMESYAGIENTDMFGHVRKCMEERIPHSMQNTFIYPDGSKGWFDLRIEPVPEGVFILSRDITRQKQAEEALKISEEQYRLLVETANEGITVTQNGSFQFINKRFEEILGYTREELMAKSFLHTVHPDDRRKVEERHKRRLEGEKFSDIYSFRIVDRTGKTRWAEVNVARVNWHGAPATLTMLSDITERKNLETERQDYIQKLRNTVESAINSLALIAETRDPYTAGHQQRVTQIACAIARELGMPDEKIEVIRIASMIHDIGKVQVPAEILSKPTKLSEVELQLIKCHPVVSHDIIKTIDMPWPIAPIVRQHHERMDGSGYPDGLHGENIVFEARILAVADVVEAMASHRPYRPAVGIDDALEEISKNKDILYDGKVVDACLRLFRENKFEISD